MERDLWKDRPNVVTVLGERLVVWWSPNESRWRCFRDQCPHRLVPLSEGRINPEGTLECPYHGWSFQGDGRCVHIPQGGELAQRRACTVAYACVLKQGMVWVKLVEVQRDKQGRPVAHAEVTEEDEASIPIIPEIEEDRDSWIVFEAHRDLPLDWSTVLENVLDAGHVPYTHHKTISRRERACSMFDLRVTEANSAGFQGLWEGGPADGMYGSQYTRFAAPGFVCHTLDARETRGFLSLTVIYVVPSEPGRCRLITRLPTQLVKGKAVARFLTKALPRWKTHTNVMIPLEDDQVFLHHGEKAYAEQRYGVDPGTAPAAPQPAAAAAAPKPLGQVFYSPNRMDVYVAALRSWIDQHGGGGPFGPQDRLWLASIGRRWTTTDLMDRYHQHTSSCATCSKALEQVRGLRATLRAAAAGLTLWAAVCAAVALAMPAVGAACAAPGGGTAAVAAAALKAGYWLVMAGDAASTMARAAGLLLASGLALAASQVLSAAEHDLLAGTYPPPRNREP